MEAETSGISPASRDALAPCNEKFLRAVAAWRPLLLIALVLGWAPVHANEELWNVLREGGHVILIRHAATVPGVGDPPGFRLDDCATQRNLSDQGRSQAVAIGEAFRRRNIPVGEVLSSEWCRCVDTARLAFGDTRTWSALNSNFNDRERETADKNLEARQRLSRRPDSGNLILVTHNFNIRDLTGVSPAQGEMVVVRPVAEGGFRVLGTLSPF